MNSKPKYMPVVKEPTMFAYPGGVVARRGVKTVVNISGLDNTRKQGDITRFSLASRRRLRDWLLTRTVPNAFTLGVTVTLPGNSAWEYQDTDFVGPVRPLSFSDGLPAQGFSDTVNRFGKYLLRAFPGCGVVWRAELQRRGAPHLHCVLWINGSLADHGPGYQPHSNQSAAGWGRNIAFALHAIVAECWIRAVVQTCFIGSAEDLATFGEGKGIDVVPLDDSPRVLRYLCDHLSKHKREQLGYRGRQWGVAGRSAFVHLTPREVSEERQRVQLARYLGKIRRTRVYRPGIQFGCRRSKYHPADSGITYAGKETMSRLLAFIQSNGSATSPLAH